MYFCFANKMTGEEREFKLQAYPYLGIGIVLPFMLLFSELRYETLDVVSEGKTYLNMYFINMVIGSLVYLIQFSGSYQGAWIFGAAGVRRSEEHTSELQSRGHLVCRLLLEKKKWRNG